MGCARFANHHTRFSKGQSPSVDGLYRKLGRKRVTATYSQAAQQRLDAAVIKGIGLCALALHHTLLGQHLARWAQ